MRKARSHREQRKILLLFVMLLPLLNAATCPPPTSNSIFAVEEMVGEVTGSSAEVFLQIGSLATREHSFKMEYDSSSHAADHDYPFETGVQTDKAEGDKLVFSIPSGLDANTRYFYSVAYKSSAEAEWTWRPERSFHTKRSPGSPFRFCVISDFHYGGGTPVENNPLGRIVQNVAADHPDFVLSLGDMSPISVQGAGEPVNCLAAYLWNSQASVDWYYRSLAVLMSPLATSSFLVWVNGNHDGLAGYLAQACIRYRDALNARGKYFPSLDSDEPHAFFGGFAWGDVHILWLDPLAFSTYDPYVRDDPTGYVLGTEQRNWLEATLAGSSSNFKLVFSHSLFGGAGPSFVCHPGKSYARGNANSVNTPGTDQIYLQALMRSYQVNAYCYGHDHMYSVSELDGVRYVLVGTGTTFGVDTACLDANYAPWNTIKNVGHLRVDVSADVMEMRYIKAALDGSNGTVLDTQSFYHVQ